MNFDFYVFVLFLINLSISDFRLGEWLLLISKSLPVVDELEMLCVLFF